MGQTSQLSRMKHIAPAADLSGGKASEDSFTPRRISLAPEDARDLILDLLLDAALWPTTSEELGRFLFPVLNTDRIEEEVTLLSRFREWERSDESPKRNPSTHHWIPYRKRPGGQPSAKSRGQQ